jgi:hypothetical protein
MHVTSPTAPFRLRVARAVRAAALALLAVGTTFGLTSVGHPAIAASPSPGQPSPTAKASQAPSTSPSSAPATFGIGPAVKAGQSERPYFSFGATPGAQATDAVTVFNYSAGPLPIDVYPVLADNTDTGAIGFAGPTDQPVDVATWLSVGATRPVLLNVPGRSKTDGPPGQVTLPLKLVIPANAEPGDHVGGIVAVLVVQSHDATGQRVTLNQRVVTRVYLRVSGPLNPKLEVVGLHASYHEKDATLGPGTTSVTYTVHNAGNVRIQATQAVRVSGLFGGSKIVQGPPIVQLLPGGSSKVTVVVPGVWPTVFVHPTVHLVPSALPGDVDPQLKTLSTGAWILAVPWVLVIVVLLVIVLMIWRRRRRGRGRSGASSVTKSPVAAGAGAVDASGRHRVDATSGRRSRHGR